MSSGWLFVLGAACAGAVLFAVQRTRARRVLLRRLRERWGKLDLARRREFESIRALLDSLAEICAAVATFGGSRLGDETLGQYVDILTLREERLYCRAAPLLAARKADIADLILRVGELDALQSLASWQTGAQVCTPELVEGASLEARAVRHPLVEGCVPNDVRIEGGVLVTGSNMSGKSTYLRAVALNALFAQVMHACLAESWTGPPVRLMTCLRRADSVLAGRSAYLSEAQGVLEIVRATGSSPRLLCILDEIFRGTNSLERIAAATEVLRWLARQGALVLAATHDHALTERTSFANVHFIESIEPAGIGFDHLLKPGPAQTTNAIALLRFLGFPEDLVDACERARATP
jgi:DNA mismatch repair ATPase MutS